MKPPIEFRPKRGSFLAKVTEKGEMRVPIPVRPAAVSRPVQTTVAQTKSAPAFDKTAYQREYMRRYRARQKAAKT